MDKDAFSHVENFEALLTMLDNETLREYLSLCFMEQVVRSGKLIAPVVQGSVATSEPGDPRDPKLWLGPTLDAYANFMRKYGFKEDCELTIKVDYGKILENMEARLNGLR